jgi:hypothetical protein
MMKRAAVISSLCVGLAVLCNLICPLPCAGQQVLLDQGVRAAGLWCFPLVTNPKEYLYLPAAARLGMDRNGGPEFSFLRYVENMRSSGETSASITEALGGGVLHFLALYETPDELVEKAQGKLREILEDKEVKLRGPIIFTSGRYIIVSSVAKAETIDEESGGVVKEVVATGNAPVLEGNKIALSFDLDKREAQILYNSFQMANPDISVVFEMQFEGVTDAYEATVDIDWSEVVKDKQFSVGAKVLIVGAEVDMAFQRLTRNNAIKLTSRGEHGATEALLNTVYSKLLDLMFRKVEEEPPPKQQTGVADALSSLISKGVSKSFSISGSYRLKDMKSSGHSVLDFNHQSVSQRSSLITFNIGDLFKRYGENQDYFKAVNLADPVYSQREVFVSVDGSLLGDFDKYINSVMVTVRKVHGNGQITLGEIIVDRNTFTANANRFSVLYGWDGDTDRDKWLDYDYRVKWSFRDGGSLEEDWKTTSSPMINVFPPYERREITVMGELQTLKDAGVKYALVKIDYDFFGKSRSKQVLAKVADTPVEQKIEIVQPKGEYKYSYETKWHFADGREVVKPVSEDASGLIFVDEMPM